MFFQCTTAPTDSGSDGPVVPPSNYPHLSVSCPGLPRSWSLAFSCGVNFPYPSALSHVYFFLSDSLTVHSIGASLTLVIPSAFVALSPISDSVDQRLPRLRVISAGAWHNLLLWGVLYFATVAGIGHAWTYLGWSDISSRGRAVVGVDAVSVPA